MASAWQSLEEAAITLGISSRTLHRRINKSEVQTRLVNGRREVLVTVAEPVMDPPPPGMTDSASPSSPFASNNSFGAADSSSDVSDGAVGQSPSMNRQAVEVPVEHVMEEGVSQTMIMLHEDRIRRTDLAIMAYQQSVTVSAAEARRNRIGQRIAWGTAGLLTIALFLSVIWSTHRLTASEAQVDHLNREVQGLSANADAVRQEADMLRREAEFARTSAARAEGELSSNRQRLREQAEMLEKAEQARQARNMPTTQPTNLMQRMLSVLWR